MLMSFARNSFFLQNLFIKLCTGIHPSIEHNIAKIEMLKKAFFYCDLESIDGAYCEFGVFEGTSFLAALKLNTQMAGKTDRDFYGFDSFDDGFKYFDDRDRHPFFKEGDSKSSLDRVRGRLKRYGNQRLFPGYFEETIQGKTPREVLGKDERCAIVFIDCDLMGPAFLALEFVRTMLQPGTIVIIDDYWAYKGSREHGTFGALTSFLSKHDTIKMRDLRPYGHGGMSFVVVAV